MNIKGQVKFVNTTGNPFYSVVRKRVDQYFKDHGISKHANTSMIIKSVALLSMYVMPFVALLIFKPPFIVALLLWVLMGIGLAGIGMSVMHDANHGAYSQNKTVNYIMGHTLNLCGGSAYNWKLQHNILHHTYTNITHMDEDIQDRLVLKFSPHTDRKWYHKFQPFYAFFFYGLLTFYWVVAKDFIQLNSFTKSGVNPASSKENRSILFKIILVKVIYFSIFLVLPVLLGIAFWQVLCGFMLMHFISGNILTLIFQLAHTVEHTTHPMPNAEGEISNDWGIHQLETTVNFCRNNKILSWYIGGLNFQIEHHLFPRIAHIHYPQIAPIVKQTAEEYGLTYRENKTLLSAIQSHFSLLRQLGLPDANDAIN